MFNSYLQRIRAVNFYEAALCGVVIKLCGICITDCAVIIIIIIIRFRKGSETLATNVPNTHPTFQFWI